MISATDIWILGILVLVIILLHIKGLSIRRKEKERHFYSDNSEPKESKFLVGAVIIPADTEYIVKDGSDKIICIDRTPKAGEGHVIFCFDERE